jgi:hypothetical protein
MKYLGKTLILLSMLLATQLLFSQKNEGRLLHLIDDQYAENTCLSSTVNAFHEIIYSLATTGYKGKIIPAFSDSACQKSISASEILEIGKSEETISYAPDPEYPDDLVDTTIIDYFASSGISRYLILMDSFTTVNNLSRYQPIAIAPLYSTTVFGINITEKPLFWVRWQDIEPVVKTIKFHNAINRQGRFTYSDFFIQKMYRASEATKSILIE